MNLILFVHQDASREEEILKKKMAQCFGENTIQVYHAFNALKHLLKQPGGYHQEIYVLLAESFGRLQELFSLIDLLDGRRIVLILPDDVPATLALAHRFYPRFFTYITTGYDDLCAVLLKMSNQNTYEEENEKWHLNCPI
jgi:hypothetical protein